VKTKSQSVGLLDDVLESMPSVFRGTRPWYERVAPEHREELASVKSAWLAGEIKLPKKTFATVLSEKLAARGIATIGHQGVIAWLEKA
jgi:hypothetical protein